MHHDTNERLTTQEFLSSRTRTHTSKIRPSTLANTFHDMLSARMMVRVRCFLRSHQDRASVLCYSRTFTESLESWRLPPYFIPDLTFYAHEDEAGFRESSQRLKRTVDFRPLKRVYQNRSVDIAASGLTFYIAAQDWIVSIQ